MNNLVLGFGDQLVQFLFIFNHMIIELFQVLACFGCSWLVLAWLGLYGPAWACLGLSGPLRASQCLSGSYGRAWASIGLYGLVWVVMDGHTNLHEQYL